jgi:hypothetical protein
MLLTLDKPYDFYLGADHLCMRKKLNLKIQDQVR